MILSKKKLQELKEKKISIEELYDKYFYTQKDGVNVENILKLLNENIYNFQEIVDKCKSLGELGSLLDNKEFFKELTENNKLSKEDLKYLLNALDEDYEVYVLRENTSLLKYIVDNELFKELVDKFKSIKNEYNDPCLYRLLWNEELFEELIQNNSLTKEDTKYLLDKIDRSYELRDLCFNNTSLIKKILNEFVLNKEDVDRFNRKIENDEECKTGNIHTIFELIEYRNKNNEEVLKLNELNEKVYLLNDFNLNLDQRLALAEILKDSEVAQNTLIQIVDNHLEDQYDFDTLKIILTKDNEKKKLKLNV